MTPSNEDFLKSYFASNTDKLKQIPLKGDGGHRSYTRIIRGKSRFVLMSCGAKDSSLKFFIDIQNRLKSHITAPQIFKADLKKGFLLLEDLGDMSLESFYLKNSVAQSLLFYKQALKQLIKLQSQAPLHQSDPIFDSDFFLEEIEQALKDIEKYLAGFSNQSDGSFAVKGLSKKIQLLKIELEKIFSDLKPEDFVFCHRDYHSRNLMLKNRQLYMIDFQDGGKGPWFYDLASLIYDCYVPLQNKIYLYQFYFDHLPPFLKKTAQSPFQIKKKTELQFLQRGLKACGRFCAFKMENNKDMHLKYIPRALSLIYNIAKKHSYHQTALYAQQSLRRFQNGCGI